MARGSASKVSHVLGPDAEARAASSLLRTPKSNAQGPASRAEAKRASACSSSSPIARRCHRWLATRRCRCLTAAPRRRITDATRGCKHLCRHCPIVPVYGGTFRAVPIDVVMQDIRAQVAAGAEHISFGDPDFFNGPTHARRIVERRREGVSAAHLRRDDQDRAHPASRRYARSAARHRLPLDHERRRIDRRRGAREAAEGTHARGFHRRRWIVPAGGRDAGADIRPVHAVDDDRRLRRSARTARCAGAG